MTAHPTVEEYLAALPAGLDSYPNAVLKASILRTFLAQTDAPVGWADGLPDPLPSLVREPPLQSAWIPEAHFHSVAFGARDHLFPTDASYLAHWRRVNDAIINGKLYRAIFALASPSRVLASTATRWAHLHRGMGLTTEPQPHGSLVRMTYPRYLLTELAAKSFSTAFESVISASGGRDLQVELLEHTQVAARWDARWR